MSTSYRTLIETQLQNFEAGEFQEFVLRFLPLYDPHYKGIIRHGHTGGGKTRKGTPDLIKTLDNGDQIVCECGTAQNYWKPPKKTSNYTKWKPIQDVQKCLNKMDRPIEIILASNRSIPTNQSNAKTRIIDHFSSKTTKIAFLTLAEFTSFIALNLKKNRNGKISRRFFPRSHRENSS